MLEDPGLTPIPRWTESVPGAFLVGARWKRPIVRPLRPVGFRPSARAEPCRRAHLAKPVHSFRAARLAFHRLDIAPWHISQTSRLTVYIIRWQALIWYRSECFEYTKCCQSSPTQVAGGRKASLLQDGSGRPVAGGGASVRRVWRRKRSLREREREIPS